jgi:hypothetical protein
MNMDAPNQWQPKDRQGGRIIFGVVLAVIGVGLLLRMFNILPPLFFHMRWGWPLVLIIIGLAMGAKHNFKNNAWWILVTIGVAHLIPAFYIGDVSSRKLLWPAMLILAGIFMITRKKGPSRFQQHRWHDGSKDIAFRSVDADEVSIDVTFGGRKEIITSKNFRGGAIRASFAGVELNLGSAESHSGVPMVLDVSASFAGVEIIVPSHWDVQNEIRPMMGSVEDNRVIRMGESTTDRPKLIVRGSVNFGSVELKGY